MPCNYLFQVNENPIFYFFVFSVTICFITKRNKMLFWHGKKNSNSTKLHLPQREREELLFTISWETFYSQTSGGTESVKKASAGSVP